MWVGSDGGVFVSDRSGRVQTFAAMSTGIAALRRTTRDEPDYDKLMRGRLAILDERRDGLRVVVMLGSSSVGERDHS